MALIIEHELEIEASKDTVWQVITDFSTYAQWNPFIVGCICDLRVGNTIEMKVSMVEGWKPLSQTEYISEVTPGTHFSYVSPKRPTFILRSYRSHTLTTLNTGKTLYQSHFELHGWLRPLIELLLGKSMQRGFDGMSRAIGRRSEQLEHMARNSAK
ncbi:MAG: SRPBCC domain-containing protein [Halioglobus sp.]